MNFWQFLDGLLNRVRAAQVAGAGIFILTAFVLHMINSNPALDKNELFKMLAQAIVVQGLVGLAMAAWFTKKPGSDDGGSDG